MMFKKILFIIVIIIICFQNSVFAFIESNKNGVYGFDSIVDFEERGKIQCFSVNSKGEVGVLVNSQINIYNAYGEFIQAYKFCLNSSVLFKFDKDDNIIYRPMRGDSYYILDRQGNLIEKIKYDYQISSLEDNEIANTKEITVNGETYKWKSTLIYDKIYRETSDGEIVYYETSSHSVKMSKIWLIIIPIGLVVLGVYLGLIVNKRIKEYKNERS